MAWVASPTVRELSGVIFRANLKGKKCETCGEEFVGYAQLAALELAEAAEIVRVGLRDGTAFRFQRKALGYPLATVAEMLCVDIGAVRAWENDQETIPTSALIAMGALVDDRVHGRTNTIEHLRALQQPVETRERVLPDDMIESLAKTVPVNG